MAFIFSFAVNGLWLVVRCVPEVWGGSKDGENEGWQIVWRGSSLVTSCGQERGPKEVVVASFLVTENKRARRQEDDKEEGKVNEDEKEKKKEEEEESLMVVVKFLKMKRSTNQETRNTNKSKGRVVVLMIFGFCFLFL